jgi:hypothetical protein
LFAEANGEAAFCDGDGKTIHTPEIDREPDVSEPFVTLYQHAIYIETFADVLRGHDLVTQAVCRLRY